MTSEKTTVKPSAPVRARMQHSEENTSDYLEAIAQLIETRGEARVVDLASILGVQKATVTKKVAQLQREGYVKSEPYRSIFLEDKGRKVADESKRVHKIVLDFLLALGINREIAEHDAEGIEHHVSKQTLAAFKKFTRKANAEGDSGK